MVDTQEEVEQTDERVGVGAPGVGVGVPGAGAPGVGVGVPGAGAGAPVVGAPGVGVPGVSVPGVGVVSEMDFAATARDSGVGEQRSHRVRSNEPRTRRPNTVVLHTKALDTVSVKEVIEAVIRVVDVKVIKAVQFMPHDRYRVTFRTNEAKMNFLSQPFTIKDVEIGVQPIESPILDVRILCVPSKVPNKVVAQSLAQYGTVETIEREMLTEQGFPTIETGTRIAKMMDIKSDIPRKSRIAEFPVEIRHKGQLPQCFRCRQLGHCANECPNDVVCFKCGIAGHTRDQCFKCFRCGKFGHVRANCPDLHPPQEVPRETAVVMGTGRNGESSQEIRSQPESHNEQPQSISQDTSESQDHPPPHDPSTSRVPPTSQPRPDTQSSPELLDTSVVSSSQGALMTEKGDMDLDSDPLKRNREKAEWTLVQSKKPRKPRSVITPYR